MFEGQGERGQLVVAYDGWDWGKIDGLDGSGRSLRLGLSFALYGHRLATRHVIGVMGHIWLWRTLDGHSRASNGPIGMIGDGKGLALLDCDRLREDMPSHHEVRMTLAGKLGLGLGASLGREAGEDGFDGGAHGVGLRSWSSSRASAFHAIWAAWGKPLS